MADDLNKKTPVAADGSAAHDIQEEIQDEIHELTDKIDELTELAEENQRMVTNLYHRARFATVVVFVKWFIIIAVTVGSVYFIQPYVDTLKSVYGGFGGAANTGDKSWLDYLKNF